MSDKLERYLDLNKMHSFEGDSGVRKFERVVREVCGYGTIEEFLADNPGAMNGLIDFIDKWSERNQEWEDNLDDLIAHDGE